MSRLFTRILPKTRLGRASAGVAAAAIGYTADRAQCLSVELDEKTAAGLLKALSKAQVESFKAVYGDLADGVKTLDKWIQAGCGDKPYYCVEKGAVFGVNANGEEYTDDVLPDFSNHNNFMAVRPPRLAPSPPLGGGHGALDSQSSLAFPPPPSLPPSPFPSRVSGASPYSRALPDRVSTSDPLRSSSASTPRSTPSSRTR